MLTHASLTIAQQSSLTLSPALVRLTAADVDTPLTAIYNLTNSTTDTIDITAAIYHIDSLDTIGRPQLPNSITDNPSVNPPAEFTLTPKQATIFPGETIGFSVEVHPLFLQPGSNYAMLTFTPQVDNTTASHTIIPTISGMLHVRNPQGETRQLNLTGTNLPSFTTKVPDSLSVSLENAGNSDITPYGSIQAKTLASGPAQNIGFLNQNSQTIYPGQVATLPATIVSSLSVNVFDVINYFITGHDELETVDLNHHATVVYISPIMIFLFSLLFISVIAIVINYKYSFISLNKTKFNRPNNQ
jgi:hypothetical protein